MSIKDSIREGLDFCDEENYPLQTNSELNGSDPEFLYDSAHDEDIRVKLRTLPDKVDILEINHFEGGNHSISSRSLNEGQLCAWLDQVNQAPARAQEPPEREIIGGLRLIMGRSTPALHAKKLPATFPHEMEDIETGRPLPFITSVFEQIIKAFHLPSITPRAFITDQSHFLRRTVSTKGFVGYTMRRPTWGVLAMNICLSISYDTATGTTYALLHGCSDTQQAFIRQQLRSLASLVNHPLLLPVLFSAHQRQLVHKQTRGLWESLLRVETASWQTDVPGVGSCHIPVESDTGQDLRGDYTQMTKETLGVIQLASGWQSTLKDIITGMDEIEHSLRHLSNKIQTPGESMETARDTFSEWLRFTRHQCRVLFGQLEYIDKRGQAQMTAVNNYIAQKDAKYSTELAADSREISAASKRDSSAMKGIALVTMVFLPGTFLATFFAMPIFDFTVNSGPQVHGHGFGIYWAVTIPLTICTVCAYAAYQLWVQRKNREEDRNARSSYFS